MKLTMLIALLVSLALAVNGREQCRTKKFPNQFEVCECSADGCDDLEPVVKTSDQVLLYESSRNDGFRFREQKLKWGYKFNESGHETGQSATKREVITIDKSKKAQTILGFGGSFTDATGHVVSQLPQKVQDYFVRDFFSAQGIEYNLNRVPIGGTDFSLRPYTYDDGHDQDFNLDHFELQDEDHKYKIAFMKKAKQVAAHPQNFFGSPWSAPAWMKNNSKINNGGYLRGKPGEQYYKTFAKYFVKFLDAYKKEGLDFWGLTIENEPGAGNQPGYAFNSMGFTPELQRDFIKDDLGPTLAAAGYGPNKTRVMIFDDQRDHIHEWCQTIYSDKEAARYVSGAAFHWYANRADTLPNLQKAHDVDTSKFILSTEAQHGGKPDIGNWNNAEEFVRDIIQDLTHHVNGWVVWNMALNVSGGPTWVNLPAYAPVIVDTDKKVYYKNPTFYGLGHVSKFISPNSVRLEHSSTFNDDQKLPTLVALRPDGGVAVVVVNTGEEPINYEIHSGSNQIQSVIKQHNIQSYVFWD